MFYFFLYFGSFIKTFIMKIQLSSAERIHLQQILRLIRFNNKIVGFIQT